MQSDSSKQSNQQNSQKQKRRRRNNQSQRQYTCGCGKSYLSYPALYTHQKQKHGGNPPLGTQIPQTSGKQNRGRPRSFNLKIDQIANLNQQSDQSGISELITYLEQLQTKICLTDAFISQNQSELTYSIQHFPKYSFENNNINYEKILLQLYEINDSYASSHQSQEVKQASCNKIFASFLNQCSQKLTIKAYSELCIFIGIYRLIANDIGWSVKKDYETELLEKMDIPVKSAVQDMIMQQEFHYLPEFSDNNFADILPELANSIIEKFSQHLQKFRNGEFIILGFKYENIKNIIFLIQFFCNWLFESGYSNTKIELDLESNENISNQQKKFLKQKHQFVIKQENFKNESFE